MSANARLIHDPSSRLSPATLAFAGRPKQLFIDNAFHHARDGATFTTDDPATGRIICEFAAASSADVDRAVRSSSRAFESWGLLSGAARAAPLLRLADLIERDMRELAELESLDNGKPLSISGAIDIPFSAEIFRYYAGWATKLGGRSFDLALQGDAFHNYTRRSPIGVVAGIVPWNFPFLQAAIKLAPALAAGCTMILKPAEQTSLTALRLAELIVEAGFPAGVVNILTGFGRVAGAALVANPAVKKVSFTGSTAAGKAIVGAAANDLKRVSLELGGKSPTVILADADVELAIPAAANAIFGNTGQVCVAGSRLLIARPIFDKVVQGVIDHGEALRVGAGLNDDVDIGPLISAVQRERVAAYVASGVADGATLAVGGATLGDHGYFYQPTVLLDTTADMKVQREEIFGPVLCATPFDDADEAFRLADHPSYGLSASVWTRDLTLAHRAAQQIDAGAIWVNCHGVYDPHLPVGGSKQSGWGYEFGQEGVEAYTSVKAVAIRL